MRWFLVLVCWSVVADADQNRIRHLFNDWPLSASTPGPEDGESLQTAGNIDVESRRREIEFQLQSMLQQVSSSSKNECRQQVKIAVASLESDWRAFSASRFQCKHRCSSQEDSLRRFQNELDVFGRAIADCAKASENRLWWMGNESGFDFGAYSQFENQSNVNHLSADDRRAGSDLWVGGFAGGVLRTEDSWHSTQNNVAYEMPSRSLKGIEWSHAQEHGVSSDEFGEYKIGLEWEQDYQWLEGRQSPERIRARDLGLKGGARWMLTPGRALSVSGQWSSESWSQVEEASVATTPSWTHRKLGVSVVYPLLVGFDHSSSLLVEWDQHTFPDVSNQPMVRGLLMAYQAEKNFSARENIQVRLGLRDWRSQNTGARLWPEGGLSIRSRSSSHPDFYFFQRVLLEPVQTPWSSYSLKLAYQSEAIWKKFDWLLSFLAEGARIRHRVLPGVPRNDTFLTVQLNPSYSLDSHWTLSGAVKYEWWWIPATASVDSSILYMRETSQNVSVLGRVQYEF